MNAEMDISKNQWRSTGGKRRWVIEDKDDNPEKKLPKFFIVTLAQK